MPDMLQKAPFFNRIKLWRKFKGHAVFGAGAIGGLGGGGRGGIGGREGGNEGPQPGGRSLVQWDRGAGRGGRGGPPGLGSYPPRGGAPNVPMGSSYQQAPPERGSSGGYYGPR